MGGRVNGWVAEEGANYVSAVAFGISNFHVIILLPGRVGAG